MVLIAKAALIGFIQGATEFLPISSTAHLDLASRWLGWGTFPLSMEMAAHFGTLIAILIFFAHEWKEIISGKQPKLFWSLVAATFVTGIFALPFASKFDAVQSPGLIAAMLAIFGLLLWWVDAKRPAERGTDDVPTLKESLTLGLAQAVALVPGVSRSGILITTGRWMKMTREQAARYAFLLSMPIIALSPLASLLKHHAGAFTFGALEWWTLVWSFIFGILAIAWLLSFLKRASLGWFAGYRILLALVILISIWH